MTEIDIPLPERVNVDDLRTDGDNPNEMTEDELEALKDNISRYGLHLPIITDEDLVIADGEHRLRAAQELGMEEVPVVQLDVDRVDRKILRQVHNKLRGEHDQARDEDEIDEILEAGREDDLEVLLGGNDDIADLIDTSQEPDLDDVEEANVDGDEIEVQVEEGDVWELGRHTVRCADSKEVIENVPEADLLLTDPPYGVDVVEGSGSSVRNAPRAEAMSDGDGNIGFDNQARAAAYKPVIGDDEDFDPTFLLDYADTQLIFGGHCFANKLPDNPRWLVWDKKPEGGEGYFFGDAELIWTNDTTRKSVKLYRHIWAGMIREGDRDVEGPRVHPTQKPVGLLAEIIQDHSDQDHTVLDPFLGSGSTLLAAEQTDRVCHGIELDPHYCQVTINRWEELTGKTAHKSS